jgi:glycine/D-amino acid oxidase-like deaminating enzyme
MTEGVGRRQLLAGAGAAVLIGSLDGCSADLRRAPPAADSPLALTPIRARADLIGRITVCTRPFRPQGPRIEAEKFGSKTVIHNYGHGGSGWSLSWGSAEIALDLARATGDKDIAVIGCGALGLTTAVAAQKAGFAVTIYTKDLPPHVRSALASGVWTPDSRICFEEHATPQMKQRWERMCRTSHAAYENLLGLPGDPVEWIDNYRISDDPPHTPPQRVKDDRPQFAEFQEELVPDLVPARDAFEPGEHIFGHRWAYRAPTIMFNISAYSIFLISQFREAGGRIVVHEFHTPRDLAMLPQNTIVNCTGYAAKELFGDHSLMPVRGQLARGITQPDLRYSVYYKGVSFVPRRDGQVFQVIGDSDYYGYGIETAEPDRAEAEKAVTTIASLFQAA